MDNAPDVYGGRLRERRTRAGYTQSDVARLLGVGQSYIANLEIGNNRPPALKLAAQFARVYRTSTDYLLGVTDNPIPPGGGSMPEDMGEMLLLMEGLPEDRRAELVAQARTYAEVERLRQRAEREAEIYLRIRDLRQKVGGEAADLVISLVMAAVQRRDYDGASALLGQAMNGSASGTEQVSNGSNA